MSTDNKKYVKTYCPKSKKYGLVTIDKNNGRDQVVNFYDIDDAIASQINTDFNDALPEVSSHLKSCATTNSRTPMSCDKSRGCPVKKGELWYQCLYCSSLEIVKNNTGAFDVYFLMDASGSMSTSDRREASRAVTSLVQQLQDMNNIYSFVPWANSATYLFKGENSVSKISSALRTYENDNCNVGGGTCADSPFDYIRSDVMRAKNPVFIIFVTDGEFFDLNAAIRARDAVLAKGNAEIMAVGITGADEYSLSKMRTINGPPTGGSAQLTSTFAQIADILRKSGNNA